MNFGDETMPRIGAALTSTNSDCSRTSMLADVGDVNRKANPVPARSCSNACSGANRPDTPGDCN